MVKPRCLSHLDSRRRQTDLCFRLQVPWWPHNSLCCWRWGCWEVLLRWLSACWNINSQSQIAYTTSNGNLYIFDVRKSNEVLYGQKAHSARANDLKITRNNLCFTCSEDEYVRVWNLDDLSQPLAAKNPKCVKTIFILGCSDVLGSVGREGGASDRLWECQGRTLCLECYWKCQGRGVLESKAMIQSFKNIEIEWSIKSSKLNIWTSTWRIFYLHRVVHFLFFSVVSLLISEEDRCLVTSPRVIGGQFVVERILFQLSFFFPLLLFLLNPSIVLFDLCATLLAA